MSVSILPIQSPENTNASMVNKTARYEIAEDSVSPREEHIPDSPARRRSSIHSAAAARPPAPRSPQ